MMRAVKSLNVNKSSGIVSFADVDGDSFTIFITAISLRKTYDGLCYMSSPWHKVIAITKNMYLILKEAMDEFYKKGDIVPGPLGPISVLTR